MPPTETRPAAPLPLRGATPWPMTLVWFGDHWNRDWSEFRTGAGQVENPAEAAREEGLAMAHLARDWMVAVGALWTFPMTAWLAAMSVATPRRSPKP